MIIPWKQHMSLSLKGKYTVILLCKIYFEMSLKIHSAAKKTQKTERVCYYLLKDNWRVDSVLSSIYRGVS